MEVVKISEVKPNPKNPRFIKDQKFKQLVTSIREFPDMLNKRPLVVFTDTDGKYVVLGGNMRLKACEEIGIKEIPIVIADEWTEEQKNEFLIKDNVGFGEWDWDTLANEWDVEQLTHWGLEMPIDLNGKDDMYTSKITAPTYTPTGEKPNIFELFNDEKSKEMISEIANSNIDQETKKFLELAAMRHVVFDYGKIAEFYAQSDIETQKLMERSALIIIDFEKAIENGYVELSKKINDLYDEEYE
jgi:hypothetical protein